MDGTGQSLLLQYAPLPSPLGKRAAASVVPKPEAACSVRRVRLRAHLRRHSAVPTVLRTGCISNAV